MAKDRNAKNCQERDCHPTILHGYVPKVKADNSQSIANPGCS